MEKDFKFTPRKPRAERDRTPDEGSLRRMSEGGKKGGAAGAGVPKNRGLAGSKWDPIIDDFLDCPHDLVKVTVSEGYEIIRHYQFTRGLNLRIKSRKLEGIKASTVNEEIYLEKLD